MLGAGLALAWLWLPATAALSGGVSTAATRWLSSGRSPQLGLLPFPLEDVMIPGETREVFMFEDRFHRCLSAEMVGGLLFTDDGEAVDVAMLLEVDEVFSDSYCVWARLKCVGRCKLSNLRRGTEHYHVAEAELYTDDSSSIASDAAADEASALCLKKVHKGAAAQRRELLELLAVDVPEDELDSVAAGLIHTSAHQRMAPFGAFYVQLDEGLAFGLADDYEEEEDVEEAECVFVGQAWESPRQFGTCFYQCRDLGELDDEESGQELEQLVATRRKNLVPPPAEAGAAGDADGAGAPSVPLSAALGEVWEEHDEACAERTLLSFAASATLGPLERAEALLMTDTSTRLRYALDKLTQQQQALSSMLVLVKQEQARSGRI